MRGLLKSGLVAIVLAASSNFIASKEAYAQESVQEQSLVITVNRKKYSITKDKIILDEQNNRVTNQQVLKQVMQTYILIQELPKYRKIAEQNLRDLNISKTQAQFEELLSNYKAILKTPVEEIKQNIKEPDSVSLPKKLSKSLLEGTIKALVDIYLNPKMYLYGEITGDLQKAEQDYRLFIRLINHADLTEYNNAINLFNILVRSEPVIKAAANSFKEVRESKNSKLEINIKEQKEFNDLLNEEDTPLVKRKRQLICNKVKDRAKNTEEGNSYQRIKREEETKIQKILENILQKFNQ